MEIQPKEKRLFRIPMTMSSTDGSSRTLSNVDHFEGLAPEFQRCSLCGKDENLLRCSRCKCAYYCSTWHQKMDWISHKDNCLPFNLDGSKNMETERRDDAQGQEEEEASGGGGGSSPSCSEMLVVSEKDASSQPLPTKNDDNLPNLSPPPPPNTFRSTNSFMKNSKVEQATKTSFPVFSENNGENPERRNKMRRFSRFEVDRSFQTEEIISEGSRGPSECETLCRSVIDDFKAYGLSVIEDFLGVENGLKVLSEVHQMHSAGIFEDGQLVKCGNTEQQQQLLRLIRGDKITWVAGNEENCPNVTYLIKQIDKLICKATSMEDNGELGTYVIRERTKAMVACYPGCGTRYVNHVDNPNEDGRVITAIYYLNLNWNVNLCGGVLRVYPSHLKSVADIAPKFDRLALFWSDRRNPHEVLPAFRTRYAITVWYFDAKERGAALSRFKQNDNH